MVSLDLSIAFSRIVLASSFFSCVGVGGFEHKGLSHSILEPIVHESSLASVVLVGAVNQLLFREVFKICLGTS